MVLVDNRIGSAELITPLREIGLDVESAHLDFADIAFEGRGEAGRSVGIGIEFKRLEEFVQSLRSGRLQGYQMPGMRDMYDHSYLFIEGELRFDKNGWLQKTIYERYHKRRVPLPGQMTVSELFKRIFVLHLCGGLIPWWTVTRSDTLQAVVALYHTWTDQDLDKHKSHLAMYIAPPLLPISDFRRTVSTFPHVGMQVSLAAERHFRSLIRAVSAGASEWAALTTTTNDGRRRKLGMGAAKAIVEFCQGSAE